MGGRLGDAWEKKGIQIASNKTSLGHIEHRKYSQYCDSYQMGIKFIEGVTL